MGVWDFLKASEYKQQAAQLLSENIELRKKEYTIEQLSYLNLQEEIAKLQAQKQAVLTEIDQTYQTKAHVQNVFQNELSFLETQKRAALDNAAIAQDELSKITKNISNSQNKLSKLKTLHKSMKHTLDNYFYSYARDSYERDEYIKIADAVIANDDELAPTVTLKLHCLDVKDLRKAFLANGKIIKETLKKYEARYTTKTNASLYKLMVIALQAELQNIIYNLKYGKLEDSIGHVEKMTQKYMQIAADGNQTIASTMVKFIGEIEYLFIQAVTIEYEYYVKKEQIKQEQLAIREQMRQEAEEKRALEKQRLQVEKEEIKYKNELDNLRSQLAVSTVDEKTTQLLIRISELEQQLSQVEHKKEEIINLQNGKAGSVYIISNLGSFGDNTFKIGMTRRLDPQERINELGSASVPFRFDVHSFIFSHDAVALEQKLHASLNDRRINRINYRKEFFKVTIDELENLVFDIEPTAEFSSTMLAEEYRQTMSLKDGSGEMFIDGFDDVEEDD